MNRIILAGSAAMLTLVPTGTYAQLAATVDGTAGATLGVGTATVGSAARANDTASGAGVISQSSVAVGTETATVQADTGASGTPDLKRATRKSRLGAAGTVGADASVQSGVAPHSPGGGL